MREKLKSDQDLTVPVYNFEKGKMNYEILSELGTAATNLYFSSSENNLRSRF